MLKHFKRYIAAGLMLCFSLHLNQAIAQKKVANGDYNLSAIALEDKSQQDTLKGVPVFEDATINCLLNSQWEFDDGTGFYKINNSNTCTKGMRQIAWKFFNLKGSNYFQFCRTSASHGVLADTHNIYVCEVQSAAKETFILRYPILYADKPNAILFTFTRQQN